MQAALRRTKPDIAHLSRLVTGLPGPDPEADLTFVRMLREVCDKVLASAPADLW